MSNKTNLSLRFTNVCNLKCPWCSDEYKCFNSENRPTIWSENTFLDFENYIKFNKFSRYSIIGGEPLLYPTYVKKIINTIRSAGYNNHIDIFTNGSLITSDLVNYFNKNNISLVFSFSLSGYKSIENIIKYNKESASFVDNIRTIKYKIFHNVFNFNDQFADDAIGLHTLFGCNVEYTPNKYELINYNDKYIDHINNQLDKLKSYNKNTSWFRLLKADTVYCHCNTSTIEISPNGTIDYKNNINDGIYGCIAAYNEMPYELYNRYVIAYSNFKNTK